MDIVLYLNLSVSFRNKYEYVIVGSGFGGTITALTLANKLEEEEEEKR